jgi:hypothetical protein
MFIILKNDGIINIQAKASRDYFQAIQSEGKNILSCVEILRYIIATTLTTMHLFGKLFLFPIDTLALIDGVINAYNGKLVQIDQDIKIQGSDPLEMTRFYDGGHPHGYEIYAPDGRGAYFRQDGSFRGFIEDRLR